MLLRLSALGWFIVLCQSCSQPENWAKLFDQPDEPRPAPPAAVWQNPNYNSQRHRAENEDTIIANDLVERVKQLKHARRLRGFKIDLQVADGEIRLDGYVPSEESIEEILEPFKKDERVRKIVIALEIRPPHH